MEFSTLTFGRLDQYTRKTRGNFTWKIKIFIERYPPFFPCVLCRLSVSLHLTRAGAGAHNINLGSLGSGSSEPRWIHIPNELGQCKALDYLVFTECLRLFVSFFLSFFLWVCGTDVYASVLCLCPKCTGQHLPANVYRIFGFNNNYRVWRINRINKGLIDLCKIAPRLIGINSRLEFMEILLYSWIPG